uniref:SCP domain-containing protein n=1 Tax=Strongyloides venezuelensis TaxID=75913 RepID=A0A0K0G229_STRVS
MPYDLAVTYKMVKLKKTQYFLYRDDKYPTKNDMLLQIINDHPQVSTTKILLLYIGTQHNDNFEEAKIHKYERPFSVSGFLKTGRIIVYEYYHQGKVCCYCLNKIFKNCKSAVRYAHLLNWKLKFFGGNKEHCEIPDDLNVAKKVGYYGFSNKVWRSVWKGCYYHSCFAENNFKQLKLRFLTEINEYRRRYGAHEVVIQSYCTKLAENYLSAILTTPKDKLSRTILQYYVEIPYYFAPLIMKKWYDEKKVLKYGGLVQNAELYHFTSIVGYKVKYVGFAVIEINDIIYFVAVFDPSPSSLIIPSKIKKKKNLLSVKFS